MDKKLEDMDDYIPPEKEIDPDELVHEQETIPDIDEEQDMDDLVHSVDIPDTNEDDELDIDDLVHEKNESGEPDGPASGQ